MTLFDQAVERLDRFIWYMSNRYAPGLQSMEASDLHQLGLMKLNELCSNPNYMFLPEREFDWIVKRSLHHLYLNVVNKGLNHSELVLFIDFDSRSDLLGLPDQAEFDELYVRHYQEHLAKIVSADASVLLEHLLNPTPAIYHMHNILCMRRRALQNQGMNVRVPTKLTQEVVGRTLGFSISKTKALLRELRQAWTMEISTNWRQSALMS